MTNLEVIYLIRLPHLTCIYDKRAGGEGVGFALCDQDRGINLLTNPFIGTTKVEQINKYAG